MKARRAWLACSVVTATYLIASCGSDDGKKNARHAADAGAGGEAGDKQGGGGSMAEAGAGGQITGAAGEASPGGGGGAPPSSSAGAGGELIGGGAGGAGGEGGAPISLFCFDRASVGGAGGAEAAGGAAPFELAFRCDDIRTAYDAGNVSAYSSDTSTIVLPRLPGMEAAIKGRAVLEYNDACQALDLTVKPDTLEIALAPSTTLDTNVRVRWLELDDECGQTVTMDASSNFSDDFCWGIDVFDDEVNGWSVDCYEGYLSGCGPVCPTE